MTAQPQVPFHFCPWGIECGWRIPYLSSQLPRVLAEAPVITHSPLLCPASLPDLPTSLLLWAHPSGQLGTCLLLHWKDSSGPKRPFFLGIQTPSSLRAISWPRHMDRPLCSGVKQSPTLAVSTQLSPHKKTALATPPPNYPLLSPTVALLIPPQPLRLTPTSLLPPPSSLKSFPPSPNPALTPTTAQKKFISVRPLRPPCSEAHQAFLVFIPSHQHHRAQCSTAPSS